MTFEEFKKFYLRDRERLDYKYIGEPLNDRTRDNYAYDFIELHYKYGLNLSWEHIFWRMKSTSLICMFTEAGLQLIEDYKQKELYKYLPVERYLE